MLYVAVEGEVDKKTQRLQRKVEIRRYEAGTDLTGGTRVAEIPDRFTRFLTVGDIEGDGDKEMVVAGFISGLWLLRPQPDGAWEIESIDRNSGGFEHASILTDLDEDGRDELYVASDREAAVAALPDIDVNEPAASAADPLKSPRIGASSLHRSRIDRMYTHQS